MPDKEEVEPRFLKESEKVRESEYNRGIQKYGHTLLTWNPPYDMYKEALSEWVALGRYLTGLQIEKEHLLSLLRRAVHPLEVLPGDSKVERKLLLKEIREVLGVVDRINTQNVHQD